MVIGNLNTARQGLSQSFRLGFNSDAHIIQTNSSSEPTTLWPDKRSWGGKEFPDSKQTFINIWHQQRNVATRRRKITQKFQRLALQLYEGIVPPRFSVSQSTRQVGSNSISALNESFSSSRWSIVKQWDGEWLDGVVLLVRHLVIPSSRSAFHLLCLPTWFHQNHWGHHWIILKCFPTQASVEYRLNSSLVQVKKTQQLQCLVLCFSVAA